jgi:transposase-like protein
MQANTVQAPTKRFVGNGTRYSEETKLKAIALHRAKTPLQEIMDACGLNRSGTLYQWIKQYTHAGEPTGGRGTYGKMVSYPAHVLNASPAVAERDRLYARAERTNVHTELLGDPIKGRSFLDRIADQPRASTGVARYVPESTRIKLELDAKRKALLARLDAEPCHEA